MKNDMILILDLGGRDNTRVARKIRELGVYTELHPHDIDAAALSALPNIKGIIMCGGPARLSDDMDASDAVYALGLPVLAVDHKAKCGDFIEKWPESFRFCLH